MTIEALETLQKMRDRKRQGEADLREGSFHGRPAVGWMCIYVPEELIDAAGALPVRIIGDPGLQVLDQGNVFLSTNICSFTRNCYEVALRGDYRFLKGVVFARMCDGIRRLSDVWKAYQESQFVHVIDVPRKRDSVALAYYVEEFQALKHRLESELKSPISDKALKQSITIYDQGRQLFAKLLELRKRERPPVLGSEMMEISNAGWLLPRENFNHLLEELVEEASSSRRAFEGKARIMLTGSIMASPQLIEQIESLGGLVVADELCTGMRYWSDPVNPKVNPLSELAQRYLNLLPCARMVPSEDRAQRLVDLAREYHVDGIINQVVRYCVTYIHDQVCLKQRLEQEKIPMLSLDMEYNAGASGQLRTRIEAFIEMLEDSKLTI